MNNSTQVWFRKYPYIIGVVMLVILSITILNSNREQSVKITEEKLVPVNTVYDIPSLLGKDLSELRTILGTPSYDKEPTSIQLQNIGTWEKTWSKDGYSLMVTYNTKTKKIIDLFLGADSERANSVFQSTDNILKVGNLSLNDPKYSVEFVKAKNTAGYTGAIIKQK